MMRKKKVQPFAKYAAWSVDGSAAGHLLPAAMRVTSQIRVLAPG